MKKNFVIIALGTNLGNRKENLKKTIELLKEKMEIVDVSSIYECEAMLQENSPESWNIDFYNCVLSVKTDYSPTELLAFIQKLESIAAGAERNKERWSPRIIDIDIISYNNEHIEQHNLIIPHPRMLERNFVVLPLLEIMPDWTSPVLGENYNKKISEIKTEILDLKIKKIGKIYD